MLLYVGKDEVSYRFPAAADFRHEPLSTSSKSIVNLGTPFVNPAIWLTLAITWPQGVMASIELLMVAAQVNRDVRHPWSA
jgi:hypothetical protein